jgi:hypothetical protein
MHGSLLLGHVPDLVAFALSTDRASVSVVVVAVSSFKLRGRIDISAKC